MELRFNFIAFSACRPNAQNRFGWWLIDSRSFTGKILLLKQKAPSKIMDVCEAGLGVFFRGIRLDLSKPKHPLERVELAL